MAWSSKASSRQSRLSDTMKAPEAAACDQLNAQPPAVPPDQSRTGWTRRGFAGGTAALAWSAAAGGCSRAEHAPEFRYTLLDGTRGDGRALSGRVVMVGFWATTCGTCLSEMPQMVALYRDLHPKGFDLLAVAMSHDPPARVASYAETHRLPFGVVIDNTGEIARAFGGIQVTPSGALIDRKGMITTRWTGPPDFGRLRAQVERLVDAA